MCSQETNRTVYRRLLPSGDQSLVPACIVAPVVKEGATSEKRHEVKRADAFNREYIEIERNGEVGSASPPAVVGKAEHHTRHGLDISLPWQA